MSQLEHKHTQNALSATMPVVVRAAYFTTVSLRICPIEWICFAPKGLKLSTTETGRNQRILELTWIPFGLVARL